MAVIVRQNLTNAGTLTSTLTACGAGGDFVDNTDGKTILHVVNASGGALTVTVAVQNASYVDAINGPYTLASVVKSVPAAGTAILGPFPTNAYNNASQQLAITYSAVTSLTIAPYKLP